MLQADDTTRGFPPHVGEPFAQLESEQDAVYLSSSATGDLANVRPLSIEQSEQPADATTDRGKDDDIHCASADVAGDISNVAARALLGDSANKFDFAKVL